MSWQAVYALVVINISEIQTFSQDLLSDRLKIELGHLYVSALVVARMDARKMDGYGKLQIKIIFINYVTFE